MEHRIAHSLDEQLARRVARKAAESYAERFARYSPKIHWENDDRARIGFSAKGVSLEGTLRLEPGAIMFDLKVPFLLKPFAGRAVSVIEEQVRHWIDVATRGGL